MAEKFPEDMNFVIVSDKFLHYDLAFDEERDEVQIFCERCDEVVVETAAKDIAGLGEHDLYEYIIDNHRKI